MIINLKSFLYIINSEQMNFQALRISNIIQFIKRSLTPDSPVIIPRILGRWEIKYCKSTINKRVDLANEDHCGICYSTKYHNKKIYKS